MNVRIPTPDSRELPWGMDPDDYSWAHIERTLRATSRIFGADKVIYPTEVTGWDNVPDRNVFLIANHGGGASTVDVFGFGAAWVRHFGPSRPTHALGHDMLFANPTIGEFFAGHGILRASRDNADRILSEAKRDLLVLPGGDVDTWRRWTDRYKVNFAGRKGYARTAIRNQVPIVPVAQAGAHDTFLVLTEGKRLSKWIGFDKMFRTKVFPIHVSLPYGIAVGPWPHLPLPTKLRYRLGKPVMPPALGPNGEITDAMVDDMDARVQAALQAELDVLRAEAGGFRNRLAKRLGLG